MMKIRKNKKIILITILLLFISIGIISLLNINQIKIKYFSHITGYNEETISIFLEDDVCDEVVRKEYSKTLDEITKTEYYKKEFILEYQNIDYIEKQDFLKEISIFLNKGYNSNNINTIYKELNSNSIEILLESEYFEHIDMIIKIPYFKEDKLKRYLSYYKNNENIETIVTYVNIGLDNPYYTNIQQIEKQDDILVLVNKYNQLNKTYKPKNLQKVSYGRGELRKEAAIAFDNMCAAAEKDKIKIYGRSGYRSYNSQYTIYNDYVKRDGQKLADTYSARAGHSEHQTGLAMDIANKDFRTIRETDEEYTWLINNSYKYGFILRYSKGKEEITGYQFEPWHYRYLGVEVAEELHKLNITYEEYVVKKYYK